MFHSEGEAARINEHFSPRLVFRREKTMTGGAAT